MGQRWSAGKGRVVAAVVVVGVAAAALGVVRFGPVPLRAQQPEDPALLRELVERLLSPPVPLPTGEVPRVRLLPGALPPELTFDLPMPPGGRLIGSAVRPAFEKDPRAPSGVNVEVVMDAPGTPADVMAFYQSALAERGWSAPPFARGPGGGGFQPTATPASAAFCQGESGPWLSMNVFPRETGPSDVRVSVNTGSPGPCSGPRVPPGVHLGPPPGFELLPPLFAPRAVRLYGSGIMSGPGGPEGPGRWFSDATAETDMPVADLEAHFARQLEAAGWTRLGGRMDGPLTWSTWAVPGEGDWQGFLYVLEGPGPNRRSLHVEVASASAQEGPFPRAVPVPAVPGR